MKKLKRRLSHAFRSSYKSDDDGANVSGHQQLVDTFHTIDLNGTSIIQQNYNRSNFGTNRKGHGSQGSLATLDLSDSLNHLSDRLNADGIIMEEGNGTLTNASGIYRRRGSRNQLYPPNFIPDRPIISRPVSYYGHVSNVCEYPNCEPQVLIRPKSRRTCDVKSKHKSFTEHLVGSLKKTGRPLFGHRNKVHKTCHGFS